MSKKRLPEAAHRASTLTGLTKVEPLAQEEKPPQASVDTVNARHDMPTEAARAAAISLERLSE
eukprot:206363-Amphidinium_carterae.1